MLSLVDKVFQDIYNTDRFIQTKGFRKYRFDDSNFYCLGTTVRSSNGYELTIAFNILDDKPDTLELCINFLNRCSLEQIRTIGDKIAIEEQRKILLYEEPDCITLVSYFSLAETKEAVRMMFSILNATDKVLMFVVK